jgi:hypothetical protein
LEFRAWGERRFGADTALAYRLGDCDDIDLAEAYLAGARMAREQEQERAKVLEDNLALLSEKVALLQAAYRGEA